MNETPTPSPRRLVRSHEGRMLGGVAAGLGRFFGVDPVLFRLGLVALAFFGGLGALLYAVAWLLVPEEGAPGEAGADQGAGRAVTVGGAIVLALAALALLAGPGLWLGGLLLPLGFIALAGLAVWWLVSGQRPTGGDPGEVARRVVAGLAVLALCAALFAGSLWASATGGGTIVAVLVIVAGLLLAGGAFTGGARWLILPTLAVAVPLAVVSAIGLDLEGSIGERTYRPAGAADVRDRYELGIGELVVDLRGVDLPPGDRPLKLDVGVGRALLLVDEDVCVASRARVGIGAVEGFRDDTGGIDVDREDVRAAPPGTARVVLDADVGIGAVSVAHEDDRRDRRGPFGHDGPFGDRAPFAGDVDRFGNLACQSGNARG